MFHKYRPHDEEYCTTKRCTNCKHVHPANYTRCTRCKAKLPNREGM